ncbi:MAG: GTP-binding protein [Candidatus Diapherotrites archaeon]|nr:GTP-binding protein [Candidatus Diapherotrites archaeon]
MKPDTIFGSVVRRVSKEMMGVRLPGRGVDKKKKLEHIRIKLYDKHFAERLKRIYQNFPNVDELPPYLQDLLEARIGKDKLKLSLGRIKGALRALEGIRDDILFKIRRARSEKEVYNLRRQYLARAYEVLTEIADDLRTVSYARSQLRRVPPINLKLPVVVLAGFPNAGKSSLLKALTGSNPKIAPYPFTTKRLLLGHFSDGYRYIQVVDTPGILDRPVEKMKPEEKEAVLSMKHLADLVIFIFDPHQDLEAQRHLLNYLKDMLQKSFLVVVGKADLLEDPEKLKKELGAVLAISPLTGEGIEELRKLIIKEMEGIKW